MLAEEARIEYFQTARRKCFRISIKWFDFLRLFVDLPAPINSLTEAGGPAVLAFISGSQMATGEVAAAATVFGSTKGAVGAVVLPPLGISKVCLTNDGEEAAAA